jgi:flavin reductase (DIM6/NTAB) family NADH-FMN oxidoreductase RutF
MNISGSSTYSELTAVEASRIFLLLNHGPLAFVSSRSDQTDTIVAAEWAMPVDSAAPKIALMLGPTPRGRAPIPRSGEFALSILPRTAAADASWTGQRPNGSRLPSSDLGTFRARHIPVPLVSGCSAWLECRLLPQATTQRRYDVYLAEILAAWTDGTALHGCRNPPAAAGAARVAGAARHTKSGPPREARPVV